MQFVLTVFLALSLGLIPCLARGLDLSAPIPIDSVVTISQLPNGITCYVRPNGWPENRIQLRLAVRVGAVQEKDNERGLAHFVEHMAFNGSAHFPPGELVRYLESIGARFGADLNAYTDYDETVYRLDVPAAPDSLLERGLQALADFAAAVTFAPEEVEKERGVVLEEWRLSRGADERMRRIIDPILYHGSRYAERDPIGLPAIIEKAPATRIRDFHRRWYRPEWMAVCVVGTVTRPRAEALVRQYFGTIPPSRDRKKLPVHAVPPHRATLVAIATDSEARVSGVEIVYKRPRQPFVTLADLRRGFARSLMNNMLNDRFRELSRIPDAPFLSASAGAGSLGRTVRTFTIGAQVPDGGIDAGLRALVIETRRCREHGFGPAELERAKASLLATYERAYNERDRSESSGLVGRCVSHFLEDEPMPAIETSYRLLQEMLPSIGLEDIQSVMAERMQNADRVIVAEAPAKEGLPAPTSDGLRSVVTAAESMPITPWVDKVAGRELLENPPVGGAIVSRRRLPDLGVTVLGLANGVEVWLKPTDFKMDQILFTGYSRGGASVVEPSAFARALQAPAIVRETGVGGFTPVEITKLMAGKLAAVTPAIGTYTHGISGSTPPRDLETALQLVYLDFTSPTPRPEGVEVVQKQLRTVLANRAQDPETAFFDTLRAVNSGHHPMSRPLSPADVEALQLEPALEFWKTCYGNAADFTFFFVGAFDSTHAEPLLARYLGGLPSAGERRARFVDRGYRFPEHNQEATVYKGREPKSRTVLTYFADAGTDIVAIEPARAAAQLLQIRLREILREQLGATYSVGVDYSSNRPVLEYGTMSISFGSAPENRARMVAAVETEIARLQAHGPSPEDVEKLREMGRRDLEVGAKQNGYWLGSLQNAHWVGWDPQRIVDRRARIDGLDGAMLQAAFQRYFPADRHTVVSLVPEK